MKATNLEAVYLAQLKDLASVEKQLAAALPKVAEAAENERLKQLITEHHAETLEQGKKINALIESAGAKAGRKKCKGMAGIIEEAEELLTATGDGSAIDAMLISGAQKAEHYEIAGYGTAIAMASQLGKDEDRQVLEEILSQEKAADRKLSALATGSVNPEASNQDQDEEPGEPAMAGASGQQFQTQRSMSMPRRDYDDYDNRGSRGGYGRGGSSGYYDDDEDNRGGGYAGRSSGGRRSSQMQERDEYGQFAGYSGGGGGRGRSYYDDDDDSARGGRSGGRRYSSQGGRYDEDDEYRGGGQRFGGYEGRARGGQHSAEMQERDEYGQFAGYSGGGGGRGRSYDDDDTNGYPSGRRGSSRGGYGGGNGGGGYGRGGDITDSAGRHYTRESWERAQEGRSLGGQHSRGGRGGYDDDDRGSSRYSSSGGGRGRSSRGGYDDDDNGYTDSAGRHYSRESWERAQEGRSLGGQHSHGGGRR